MKHTYTETLFIDDLTTAEVTILVYNRCKYSLRNTKNDVDDEPIRRTYTGLTSWDIIDHGVEAKSIEDDLNEEDCDEHHEYLVLHFENGETATFRNSHVDLFIN